MRIPAGGEAAPEEEGRGPGTWEGLLREKGVSAHGRAVAGAETQAPEAGASVDSDVDVQSY